MREDTADSCSSFSYTRAAQKHALLLLCTCAVQHYVEEFQRQFKFCRLLVFSPVFRLLAIVHVMVTCSTPSFSVICERSKTGQWEGLEAWFTCIIAWCFSHECPGMQSNIRSQWCGSVWLGLYTRFDNDSRTFGSSSQDCLMTPHQAIGSIFIN